MDLRPDYSAGSLPSPIGILHYVYSQTHLLWLDLSGSFSQAFEHYRKSRLGSLTRIDHSAVPELLEHELGLYFNGELKVFTCPLQDFGTSFMTSVWRELRMIPYGRTASYRDIAASLGRPGAVRAVGNANGQNPIPILTPCHRVIRSDGSLGGYSGGRHIKKLLLELEARTFKDRGTGPICIASQRRNQ